MYCTESYVLYVCWPRCLTFAKIKSFFAHKTFAKKKKNHMEHEINQKVVTFQSVRENCTYLVTGWNPTFLIMYCLWLCAVCTSSKMLCNDSCNCSTLFAMSKSAFKGYTCRNELNISFENHEFHEVSNHAVPAQ